MSTNRLFLYEPESNEAVCIAKGYSSGWITSGPQDHVNDFFERNIEFTGEIVGTRYQLRTETDLPPDCHCTYATE